MATKLLAFGEVMMRFSPGNHMKLHQAKSLDFSFTGTGVNILSALSRYGNETSLVTCLPKNSIGEAAIRGIRSLGISTQTVKRGGEYIGMYFLETGFGIRPTKVTYTNRKESSFCKSKLIDYDFDAIFKDASLIHFCGISLAISEETRQLVLGVAKEAKKRKVKVAFDCNYRPKLWNNDYNTAKVYYDKMLNLADICFMTDRDAEYILGLETSKTEKKDKLEDLLPRVAEMYNIEVIAGTIRENPSTDENQLQGFIVVDGKVTYSKQYTFKILDRIGGGDGFASGIIHGYVKQNPIQERVEFATAAGVLAHTTVGDAPISTVEEIESLVKNEGVELER